MPPRLRRSFGFCFTLLMLSCTGSTTSSSPSSQGTVPSEEPSETLAPFAGGDVWIAYQTDRSGSAGIWLIHPDGTDDHQIAGDIEDQQLLPNWSPDGSRIVFATRGGKTESLFEYDLATQETRQLFDCKHPCLGDDEPVYSPDGTEVAFIRALGPLVTNQSGDDVPSDCAIWIGAVATGTVHQVTTNTHPPCDREILPRWSPDGRRLTYWRELAEKGSLVGTSVYVLDADGSHARRLTKPSMFAAEPDWSPDGRWIVFSTHARLEFECCEVSDLYRMHPDGSGIEQLTDFGDAEHRAGQPRYTPDGDWIIFTFKTETGLSLWALRADGGDPVEIVAGGIYSHGTWQPSA
jgi:Tol biopolymer transport system component